MTAGQLWSEKSWDCSEIFVVERPAETDQTQAWNQEKMSTGI